jgi:hypothetical protein
MQRRTLLLGSCLATMVATVGCFDQTTAPAAVPSAARMSTAELERHSSLAGTVGLSRDMLALTSLSRMADVRVTNAIEDAVTPSKCSTAAMPINLWLNAELGNTLTKEPATFFAMYDRYADLVPLYEALVFQTSATPQTYGYDGEFTHAMVKVERDVKNFWDIKSDDIQVVAMHGTTLLDVERVAATYLAVFGNTPAKAPLGKTPAIAVANATAVRDALLKSTTMNGGNFAFWTFNAVSYPGDEELPKKIVMGDGIMEGYRALGFGDVAPQAIFAHEFGHQIQFANGYYDDLGPKPDPTALTRYTELMADAMSAYYLTHSRGASLNQKRVAQFLEIFFEIGDCGFTSSGHHGTPAQRMAAAKLGFTVADEAQKQGHILSSDAFHARFVAALPSILAAVQP